MVEHRSSNGYKKGTGRTMNPKTMLITGAYFDDLRAVPSAPQTHDETMRRRLWEISEQLCQ